MYLSIFYLWIISVCLTLSFSSYGNEEIRGLQKKQIEEVRADLERIQAELNIWGKEPSKKQTPKALPLFKKSNLTQNVDALDSVSRELNEIQAGILKLGNGQGVESTITEKEIAPFAKEQALPIDSQVRGLGVYILPFFGALYPNSLEWKSTGGDFEIKEKVGFSGGLRTGFSGDYVFADFQLSYFTNDLESIDLGSPGLDFSGDTSGVGFHLSVGGKLPISQHVSLFLGGGLGGTHQDISFQLMGIPVGEEEIVFSYQLFSGVEFSPSEHLRLGLRYRWLRVGEMKLFTSRDLHLAELSLGYVF